MYKLWRKPRPFLAAAAIAGLTLALAGTASAQATVGTFYNQETITVTFTDVSLCTGLTHGHVDEHGHRRWPLRRQLATARLTSPGRQRRTTGRTGRTGAYLITHSPAHWEFNTNSTGLVVYTWAQQDPGILYNADGQVIGQLNVFTLTHVTWRDANGNGQPDPDEIRSTVDQFRVTCPRHWAFAT